MMFCNMLSVDVSSSFLLRPWWVSFEFLPSSFYNDNLETCAEHVGWWYFLFLSFLFFFFFFFFFFSNQTTVTHDGSQTINRYPDSTFSRKKRHKNTMANIRRTQWFDERNVSLLFLCASPRSSSSSSSLKPSPVVKAFDPISSSGMPKSPVKWWTESYNYSESNSTKISFSYFSFQCSLKKFIMKQTKNTFEKNFFSKHILLTRNHHSDISS